MSVIATALKHLIAAGLSGDDLVRAVADMEAATDTRSTGAKRQQRYRQRETAKRNEASQSVTRVTSDADPIPPNDIYSNPPENLDGAKAPCLPFSEKAVSAWNDGPGREGATRANALDANRRKALSLRVREHGEDGVLRAIANLGRSPFHCGKNDRGWRANIGWLLKSPENFMKALEMGGDAATSEAPASPEKRAEGLARKAEIYRRLGRDVEADDLDREVRGLRNGSTGPPRGIGQLAAGIASAAHH